MDREKNLKVITLGALWEVFRKRFFVLLLVGILSAAAFFGVFNLTYVPLYKSTATLYILKQDSNSISDANTSSDFSLALNVVNDCTYLLKSHAVLDDVIDRLGLNTGFNDLYNSISTTNPDGTRILEVTVTADSPNEAKRIVDSICEIGADKIASAMGFEQVNLYEYGTLADNPSNELGIVKLALVGAAAAAVTYIIFLAIFLIDDRIRTAEDVENYLGLSLLGEIPNMNDTKKKGKYGYYSHNAPAKHRSKANSDARGGENNGK